MMDKVSFLLFLFAVVVSIPCAYPFAFTVSNSVINNGQVGSRFAIHSSTSWSTLAMAESSSDNNNNNNNDDDTSSITTTTTTTHTPLQYSDRLHTSDTFRCGFVSIVGEPNVGKSTLLNALLRESLCVSSHRPQTTRHAILGVLTSEVAQAQLCFLDTPGMIADPAYRLQEGMMEAVRGAVRDGDVILVVVTLDTTANDNDNNHQKSAQDTVLSSVQKTTKPVIVVINKCDVASSPSQRDVSLNRTVQKWRALLPKALLILPCTALSNTTTIDDEGEEEDIGVTLLRSILLADADLPSLFRQLGRPTPGMFASPDKLWLDTAEVHSTVLPLGPPLYDRDSLTDRNTRFFVSELIRGVLFTTLSKELPYCCEVRIQSFREPSRLNNFVTNIAADILVERESQKRIVVGTKGSMIRQIGTEARAKLKDFLQEDKLFLQLSVKVEKDWRKKEDRLREFGYLKPKKK